MNFDKLFALTEKPLFWIIIYTLGAISTVYLGRMFPL